MALHAGERKLYVTNALFIICEFGNKALYRSSPSEEMRIL